MKMKTRPADDSSRGNGGGGRGGTARRTGAAGQERTLSVARRGPGPGPGPGPVPVVPGTGRGACAWRNPAQKKKDRLVHKFKVKKEFYRTVKKGELDEVPEFYKEIFGDGAGSLPPGEEESAVVRAADDREEGGDGACGAGGRRPRRSGRGGDADLNGGASAGLTAAGEEEAPRGSRCEGDAAEVKAHRRPDPPSSSGGEEEGAEGKGDPRNSRNEGVGFSKGQTARTRPKKRARPHPFENALRQREKERQEREAERERARKEREERERGREEYYRARESKRRALSKRTGRGQPVMRNQIKHLLSKIMQS